ncbi:GNAT family N-acetyltransferase [Streptomyces iconiensis]|uniref:GNAT family N-acetyltransferase n=1 Tax=Streptomyces iconiensis TaxID=1384038 RepID=A0ABT6ZXV4_9ACTN|nr:GNAT family N-acetyltransferase [Streptomyces iconiensis]MDJ1133891.1 GNAT family N-acetyltransferase [Streptomyces iconiensis]
MTDATSHPSAPVIETERLLLRPLSTSDVDRLVALHADPQVHRFVPHYTYDQALERLSGVERQWAERGHGLCAVELKGTRQFLGRCGLNHWEQFDEIEAGWTFTPSAWGYGYATEAARACVDWGFARLEAPYFTAMIDAANTASLRVAQRLGFRPLREDTMFGKPLTVYALHRAEHAERAEYAGQPGQPGQPGQSGQPGQPG